MTEEEKREQTRLRNLKYREYRQAYYKKNRKKYQKYHREYQKKNYDKISQYQKKYYEKNRDKIIKRNNRYKKIRKMGLWKRVWTNLLTQLGIRNV